MSGLTVIELEEKIKKAKQDAEALRATGESSRKIEVFSEYIEMLEEDLYNARKQENSQEKR